MKIVKSFTLLICMISAVFADAQPGSIGILLNDTSVNHLMATFVPILSYYALNN